MKTKRIIKTLSILLCCILSFTSVAQLLNLPVKALSYAYGVEITTQPAIYVDDTTVITLNIKNIAVPLSGLQFVFTFNNTYLTPIITNNTQDEMNAFMVKTPPNGWEQLCFYDAANSRYTLRFAANDGGTDADNLLKTDGDLIVKIPFIVKKAGEMNFSVTGAIGTDKNLVSITGADSSITATSTENLNRFSVKPTFPENVTQSSSVNLTVTITNNNDFSGLIGIEFAVLYDPAVIPVITKNDSGQMDAFLSPDSGWEQMCTLDSTNNRYLIRIAANNVGSSEDEILQIGEQLTLTIPFKVTGTVGENASFVIPISDCTAVNNILKSVGGSGDTTDFTITKAANISLIPATTLSIITSGNLKMIDNIRESTSVTDLLSQFINTDLVVKNSSGTVVTDGICKTGDTINLYNGETLIDSATLIVEGDVSGDGKITALDYLYIKRAFIGSITLNYIQNQAACIKGSITITAGTYLMIKRHVLGTFNIYA